MRNLKLIGATALAVASPAIARGGGGGMRGGIIGGGMSAGGGAAIIMQWNTLPTSLQREIFDTAGSVGKLWETAALRGQIARFLHKHKNESGHVKLPLTEDTAGDARAGAAALSRWDNEGGAVRDALPT